jgi:rod shape-determining protein MreC
MAQQRGRRRVVILSVLLLASLTLLAIGGPFRTVASKVARAVVSPFVSVVHGVTKPIGESIAGIFNYGDVVAQNHALSAEIGQLKQQQIADEFDQRQLRDITALNRLPFIGSLPTVIAQMTAPNLSNFVATIEINKGTTAGVLTGMPVVGAGGLVGIVTSSTTGGATVTLLTDASQTVGVSFGPRGYNATVQGQGPNRGLLADLLVPGTPVHVGEHVFTNGQQGGLYPPGIPVGTIAGAPSGVGTEQTVPVNPIANLSNLAYVSVVLWEPGT